MQRISRLFYDVTFLPIVRRHSFLYHHLRHLLEERLVCSSTQNMQF